VNVIPADSSVYARLEFSRQMENEAVMIIVRVNVSIALARDLIVSITYNDRLSSRMLSFTEYFSLDIASLRHPHRGVKRPNGGKEQRPRAPPALNVPFPIHSAVEHLIRNSGWLAVEAFRSVAVGRGHSLDVYHGP
jgi:hypothetical protein